MSEEDRGELKRIFELSKENDDTVTVGATVDTGLEWQAIDECREKLNQSLRVFKDRGKIFFNVSLEDFPKVQKLRSVDNIYIIADVNYLTFDTDDKEKNVSLLEESVKRSNELDKCLKVWKTVTNFPGKMFPTVEEHDQRVDAYKVEKEIREKNYEEKKGKKKRGFIPSEAKEDDILSFRVTCDRSGKHTFDSNQAAVIIGGEFHEKYHWIVDLSWYHLEIFYKIVNAEMILHLRVTPESLHRRNIHHFGPTTLRATVCYNLLRLANPKPGDIIIDPMCGGGSIPIEAAMEYPTSYVLGGDNHDKALERSRLNFESLPVRYKADLVQWNVRHLPFKDSSVDAFITDMPFGKRMGSMSNNRVQYKHYLIELGRVVRQKYGKLVLLTYDRRSIGIALQVTKELFSVKKTLFVSMGGLSAAAYVLKRTNFSFEQFQETFLKDKKAFKKVKLSEKEETNVDNENLSKKVEDSNE